VLVDGGTVLNLPIPALVQDSAERIALRVTEQATYSDSSAIAFGESLIGLILSGSEDADAELGLRTGTKIIDLPSGGAGFLDASMPPAKRAQLFQAGRQAVQAAM
jgi:hypothetical protein